MIRIGYHVVTQTEAIKRLLTAWTHHDLAGLYTEDMEVQVQVAQDDGAVVEGTLDVNGKSIAWRGFSDDTTTWKDIRIPYNASKDPTYTDKPMRWDLTEHALGIGMTGWDFHAKVSKWVGFDFDAMIGHSQKHSKRLSDDELLEIESLVKAIPWVTVRKSTGGKGLHIYVMLDNVPTETHTEHAALARAVLGLLSAATGHPLHTAVDVCGHILWAWHRKIGKCPRSKHLDLRGADGMYVNHQGLRLIKQGCKLLDIPANWREHLQVVSGTRKRLIPDWVRAENREGLEKLFEELSGQHSRAKLEPDHLKLIQWIKVNEGEGYSSWFDPDNHMLVTHTHTLEAAHKSLDFRGVYRTTSTGSSTHNCFCYPIRGGAWAVRRFSIGVHEDDTWTQDGNGWTRCFFNREPDLRTAAVNYGGIEKKDGSYQFASAESAQSTLDMLGTKLVLKGSYLNRSATLSALKDGRIHLQLPHESSDKPEDMPGWLHEKNMWKKIFSTKQSPADGANELSVTRDFELRHLVFGGEDYGWALKTNGWNIEPLAHIKIHLGGVGLKPQEEKQALAAAIANPWRIVSRPFEPEYPGEREWNRDAVQFRWAPSMSSDTLSFPTWNKILTHCGKGLDEVVSKHDWCMKNGIKTGRDYLLHWIASLFQKPERHLPYLFFYGLQNSGKTTLHEAIEAILTGGVVKAHVALTGKGDFNGELEHAILGVVEEINLAATPTVYNKMKELITAKTMLLHVKHVTPCQVPNLMHWIQCGNDRSFVPVFPNDTRIMVIKVDELKDSERMDTLEMMRLVEREAPDFTRYCLDMVLPDPLGRVTLPVIETQDKLEVQKSNMSLVEQFIDEMCVPSVGNRESYTIFWEKFKAWLQPKDKLEWTQPKMGKLLPMQHAKGTERKSNLGFVTNLSFDLNAPKVVGPKYTVVEGFLKFE